MGKFGATVSSSDSKRRYEAGGLLRQVVGRRKLPRFRYILLGIGCLVALWVFWSLSFSTDSASYSVGAPSPSTKFTSPVERAANRRDGFDSNDGVLKTHHELKSSDFNTYQQYISDSDVEDIPVDESFSGYIYLDWSLPSSYFDLVNYKSLESILHVYPNAKITILLIGPQAADYYKCGDLLSKHYFQKYQKRGYNIKFNVIFRHPGHGVPGLNYWMEHEQGCCKVNTVKDFHSKDSIPYHLAAYVRVYHLYKTGGIFSDFSWMHVAPMSDVTQGAFIRPTCAPRHFDEKTKEGKCIKSSIYLFRKKHDPVLKCILDQYGRETSELYICIKLDQSYSGSICVQQAFDRCFKTVKGSINEFKDVHDKNSIVYGFDNGDGYQPALMDALWGQGGGVGNVQARRTVSYVLKTSSVVWLGGAADGKNWEQPTLNSFLDKMLKRIHLKKNGVTQFVKGSKDPICQAPSRLKCSHYKVFNSTDDRGMKQASISCSPTYVIPGFMKAGTTFLYETLGKHPQVLKALRGVAFKETGCYMESQMTESKRDQRMQCFPYVDQEESGYFAYGDGTVYYHSKRNVPAFLKDDNPEMRAVFVVRDPIDRLVSHFKFAYKSLPTYLQDVNRLVGVALRKDGAFMKRRADAVALMEILKGDGDEGFLKKGADLYLDPRADTFIEHLEGGFVKTKDEMFRKAASLMVHSLYPPAILHWQRVFGRDSVLVVSSEKLRVSKRGGNVHELRGSLDRVYKFLGLCPFKRLPETTVHETRDPDDLGDKAKLNETMIARLQEFYAPYNEILSLITNGDVTYNEKSFFSRKALEFKPSYDWKSLLPWQTIQEGLETRLSLDNTGHREARIPNPFRLQIALPKPCKYFARVDMYKGDYIRKIKDEASAQCNKSGFDVPSECFELLETGVDENEEFLTGYGIQDTEERTNQATQQKEFHDKERYRVIKDIKTVEEMGLFHKSLRLKIKDGPCYDFLPNIYK